MPRIVAALLLAGFFALMVGCGSSAPTGPNMSEEERQKQIRQDIENVQKERKGPAKKP